METKNATKRKKSSITTNEAELFQSLVENSMVGIYIIQDDKLRYVNPRFAEIFGYSQEELIDSSPESIVAEEDRTMVMENIRARMQGKKRSIHYLVKGQKKGGELIFTEVLGSLTQYEGRPAIIGSLIDTTEREIAKQQIVKEKNLTDTIINSLPTSFSLWDITGKYIRWNKRLETFSGYTKNEISKMNVMDFVAEERDKEAVQKTIEKVLKKGWAAVEISTVKKNGRIIPWYLNLQLVEYEGKPCLISQGFDISLRKRIEEKLQKLTANLYTIFSTTDTAYILVDKDLRIISLNHEASDILKHEVGVKPKVGEYLSSDHFADVRFTENLASEVLGGQYTHFEVSYPQRDGSNHWYFVRVFPIKNLQKEIFGMMLAISNITERKNAEIQQEKMSNDLVLRNKDLEQFTYIVSHNLRAPVASMLGISEVLHSNQITSEEHSELEQFLFNSVHQLNEIIKDLNYILQVKKAISERKEAVSFSQLVEDITLSIQNIFKEDDVQIRTDFSAVDEFITIKSYLYSIFYNLISNSIKYKQPDKKQIIEIKSAKDGEGITLTFKDVGMGMDLEQKSDQVFGIYNRFHPEIEGKGMGLFMVKTQVEMLGGTIQVKSEPNVGTEFIIEFKEGKLINP